MVQLTYLELVSLVFVTFVAGMLIQTKIYDYMVHGHQRALRRHAARFRRGSWAKIDALGLRVGDDPQELPNYVWHGTLVQVIDVIDYDRALIELPTGEIGTIGLVLLRPADERGRLLQDVPRGTGHQQQQG